jgi:carbamoyltransferase
MKHSQYILGISSGFHDSAACLVRDGELIAAAQEERFSRIKHDNRYPEQAIAYCLKEAGVGAKELASVAFYEQPVLKFNRLLNTYLAIAPNGFQSFCAAIPGWCREKLWTTGAVKRKLGYGGEIICPEHHQSHAASAFFPSPYSRAAILTIDGVGEWATTTIGTGQGNRINLFNQINFPHSLGLLYTAFTTYTGFKANSGEYKVMGLAPYGEPKYVQTIFDRIVDLKEDGSFRLDQKYFNYCQGLTMTSEAFHELFGGPPREPESELTQREMDLARSVQEVTEEIVLRMGRHLQRETGERNLCLAGGVALNCVANGKLLRSGVFDNIWIQPAAGDAGGSLGAALYAWHVTLGQPRRPDDTQDTQKGSLLGPAFSSEEVAARLGTKGARFQRLERDEVPRYAASALADGKVVGWFQGRMEFGPRALGARSILGDPRDPRTQSVMNLKIKYRESFRPFAPSCLLEDVSSYFELETESPYMLLVADVRPERRVGLAEDESRLFGIDRLNVPRSDIPAVTHVDYSARVQTVSERWNPAYYQLLTAFKQITGYGVIVNTSFNVRGEPIVCSPEDAYTCFMRTEMDILIIEDWVLLKEDQSQLKEDSDWRTQFAMD